MSFQPVTIIYFWRKKFAKGQEPTGAFDFKACLVILEFQLGKGICSYPLRAGHSAGILTAGGWRMSVKREQALWWEKLPGSSSSKRLRLHFPWMLENSSKSLSRHPAETLLVSASRDFRKRNMNFPGSTMLRILQGKAQRDSFSEAPKLSYYQNSTIILSVPRRSIYQVSLLWIVAILTDTQWGRSPVEA